MYGLTLIEVQDYGFYTWNAYCELRLQMSTGEFHTHKYTVVTIDPTLEYTDLDEETGEFFLINEVPHETA